MVGRVNDQGAKDKTEALLAHVRDQIQETLPTLVDQLLALAVERAPTPEEEYTALMVGDGNPSGVDYVPLSGRRSADPDNRIRLDKADWLWIQEAILSPENFYVRSYVNKHEFGIGELGWLSSQSYFQFTNITAGSDEADAPAGDTFINGPYFEAFEFGQLGELKEKTVTTAHGDNYLLRPDAE